MEEKHPEMPVENDNSNAVIESPPLNESVDKKETENNNLPISWTGPEFVAYRKNPMWYLSLVGVCILICALLYLLTRDIITIVVVVVAFISVGVYGARKPKEITYSIDSNGAQVGDKKYFFESFRNFNVANEDEFTTATLYPLKRFAFTVSLSFTKKDEQNILNILTEHLPVEKHQPDLIDRLMIRIRF